ncbi:MAG: response regulator [Alphaproteobacteria bacterium]|nr:response regulator [Alphaproteobacteria bacterium]
MSKQKFILVVEDEPSVARKLELALHGAGYAVIGPAGTQPDALALLSENRPDAAVLDLQLQGTRGVAILDALAEQAIPFCITTGFTQALIPPSHRWRSCVLKPYQPGEVIAQVEELLRNPRPDI